MTFEHIRWIGGGSGAGKTTVARILAKRLGARVHHTDASMRVHADLLDAEEAPLLARFREQSLDERWVMHDPATMLATFPWFHGEGFDLILDDLARLPRDRIILVEGFRLLPPLVAPLLGDPDHAVWLLPTPAFRERSFAGRPASDSFWRCTGAPDRALTHLLARDALFTDHVAEQCARLRTRTIDVDIDRPVSAVINEVSRHLAL